MTSERLAPEDLTIEILEHTFGSPPGDWEGRCSELAHTAVQIVGGVFAYGHYLGIVDPTGYWGGYASVPFVRHAWVTLPDGRILDPTAWSFRSEEPNVALEHNHGDYDEGGQMWRAARRSPPPKDEDNPVTVDLRLCPQANAHINAMLLREGNSRTINAWQAVWLASSPLADLGDFAQEFFEELTYRGHEGAIPIDHKRMVLGG